MNIRALVKVQCIPLFQVFPDGDSRKGRKELL